MWNVWCKTVDCVIDCWYVLNINVKIRLILRKLIKKWMRLKYMYECFSARIDIDRSTRFDFDSTKKLSNKSIVNYNDFSYQFWSF